MRTMTDALDRHVTYNFPPKRMISLDPALTETLFYLDLDEEVVGRTRFCIHPQGRVEQAINIGGTKDIKIERIHDLKPDLIMAEKEENTKEIVETLEKHYPVYVFEIQTVRDALKMIEDLGYLTHRAQKALTLKKDINSAFKQLPSANRPRVGYMIWKKPYMAVGRDTYINDVLETLGFVNPLADLPERYPVVTEETLQQAQLDYLFLSSEPYPFRDIHYDEFLSFLPDVEIIPIDGEMFWYGRRMLQAAAYFSKLLSERITE